jgi:hypothetical protein
MPSPITFPLSGPVKWLVRVTPWAFYAGELLYDQIVDDAPDDLVWHRAHLVFTRATPTGTVEDVAICTFDLLNFTDGAIDSTWVTADFVAAEARFGTYWTALRSSFPDETILKEIRWYRRQFAEPMTTEKRFADSGPPVRITPIGTAGTATANSFPYQVAFSITERTPDPKHWGRWYLPAPAVDAVGLTAYGRFSATAVSSQRDYATTLMNGLWDDQLPLVVPTTQVNKTLVKGWMAVSSIQVDDVPDVQRRRRAKQTLVRSVGNIT